MHFFTAFKENLENFKSRYVKRCERVLGVNKKAQILGKKSKHMRYKRL